MGLCHDINGAYPLKDIGQDGLISASLPSTHCLLDRTPHLPLRVRPAKLTGSMRMRENIDFGSESFRCAELQAHRYRHTGYSSFTMFHGFIVYFNFVCLPVINAGNISR